MSNVIPLTGLLRHEPPPSADVKAAMDYGYQVHTAIGDHFDSDLQGKWWWTLSKPGWVDCVTDHDEHASEAEAWACAVQHHKAELLLDNRDKE